MDEGRYCATVLVICVVVAMLQRTFAIKLTQHSQDGRQDGDSTVRYTREYLIEMKTRPLSLTRPDIDFECPSRKPVTKKKRGSRGGVRNRLRRRGARLPMPSVTLTNARSLRNKMTELETLIKCDGDYRRSNLICVTETWLSKDDKAELEGYEPYRLDRDSKKTDKEIGGGLIVYVNRDWATNVTVRETINTPDYEILSVSIRPHYLPREFTQVSVILAYVPGPDDNAAAECIAECYNRALSRSADQPVLLLGDFNTCDPSKLLPQLQQCVTKPTHEKREHFGQVFCKH